MTDVRTGKVAIEALVQGTPNQRVGAVSLSALVKGQPHVKVGKCAVYVLYPFSAPPPTSSKRRVACVIT